MGTQLLKENAAAIKYKSTNHNEIQGQILKGSHNKGQGFLSGP